MSAYAVKQTAAELMEVPVLCSITDMRNVILPCRNQAISEGCLEKICLHATDLRRKPARRETAQ